MGILNFICKVAALSEHDSLAKQLSSNKAKGLDDTLAGAVLVLQRWDLPLTDDSLARATQLSLKLGKLLIGFLMFSKRIGVEKAVRNELISDPFHGLHGCLYFTAKPLTDFARKDMNRIWNKQRVDPTDISDSVFAAYYATLIVPVAVDAWLMLAELRRLGFCPEIDNRDHTREGIENARRFLETAKNADPEFRASLSEGIRDLNKMERR